MELKPPYRALFEITWRCDLRCDHCLVDGGAPTIEELTTDEALSLVDQIADLGVSAVSLTGGEPFLRKDWKAIARRVREKGMMLRFAANGHFLNDKTVSELVTLETQALAVSIDGVKATHDYYRHGPNRDRGPSSFDRVVAALDRLRYTPIIAHVITSVAKHNLAELGDIHVLLKEHGVQKWILQLAHRTGRLAGNGKENESASMVQPIEPGQLPELAEFIVENADDPILQPTAFNSIGYLSKKEPIIRKSGIERGHPIWHGCECGRTVIGIEPDGGIKGCANQVGAPFVVGNIREESLETIWKDRKRWHWLNPEPSMLEGQCAGCPLAKVCHAGCTTLSYSSTNQLFNNPYCLRALERKLEETSQ